MVNISYPTTESPPSRTSDLRLYFAELRGVVESPTSSAMSKVSSEGILQWFQIYDTNRRCGCIWRTCTTNLLYGIATPKKKSSTIFSDYIIYPKTITIKYLCVFATFKGILLCWRYIV